LETFASRRGINAFRNERTMQVRRKAPESPLYYWTADGWDVELLYQKQNAKGVTTYHNRLTIVVVLDACKKYPIGYAIGDHETPELINEAFRNAVNHTAQLFGSRHRAQQVQSDRYAIKALTPLYQLVGAKHTPARVGNAKAKIVERYFLSLNKNYCQVMPNWSGFGLTARKEAQPNVDFINKFRHSFPDYEGCKRQIVAMMELERSKKIDRYLKAWEATPEKNKLPLSTKDYLLYFGQSTGQKNLMQGNGLTLSIGGIKRTFECFEPEFRKHYGVRWTVLHDPQDLSEALAVNDDGKLQFMLQDPYVQPMALMDRAEGDKEPLQEVRNFNRLLEASITEAAVKRQEVVQGFFEERPELNDTLSKLLIVDSHGQHKNNRNKPRRVKARKPTLEVEAHEDFEEIKVLPVAAQVAEEDFSMSDMFNSL
ncbi:MAG: hypothetical protein ACRCZB_00215, partial [Bacteroidales bacterium]